MCALQRLICLSLLLALMEAAGPASAQPLPPVERVSFYEVLTPYGAWVTVAGYGHVWRPHAHVVGADFYPYFTAGHWAYTAWGWTWVSEFPWGWVPFHHGRWLYTDEYGWVWVPDDAWAPAWVEWRFGGGYVGWVPLGPAGVLHVYAWYAPRWCWVPARHLHQKDFHRHRLHRAQAEEAAFHSSTPVPEPEAAVPRGPAPQDVIIAGGEAQLQPALLPRRLPPGAVFAERRIAVTRPGFPAREPAVRPVPAPARPWDAAPPRWEAPPPRWREPVPAPTPAPWPGRGERPPSVAPALRPAPELAPAPVPPPMEPPEALKKKPPRGPPGPLAPLPPGPVRKPR